MADGDEEQKREKRKKPSAREIVGSIFDERKKADKKEDPSALFRPADVAPGPEKVQEGEKPAGVQEQAKKPSRPSRGAKFSRGTRWLGRTRTLIRRALPTRSVPVSALPAGEWADRRDLPVGLEIGTQFIRVVQLAKSADGKWKLINCAVRPFSHTAGASYAESHKAAEDILRDIFSKPLKQLTSVSSFSESTAITQVLRLPHMPTGEIRQAVAWELQERYSMRSEDWYFDSMSLPVAAGLEKKDMSVLFAAIPRRELTIHVNTLKSIGLRPVSVEVKPLPTWEMLTDYEWPADSAVLLVELGEQNSYITVVVDKLPAFIHTLTFTGETLTKVLESMFRFTIEQAQVFKHEIGLTQSTPAPSGTFESQTGDHNSAQAHQAYLALRPFAERLIAEIEQAFKYFSFRISQSETQSFSRILMSGKSAQLKGLSEFVAESLGVPVEYAASFRDIAIDENTFDRGELEAESLGLTTAIGLAMRRDDL